MRIFPGPPAQKFFPGSFHCRCFGSEPASIGSSFVAPKNLERVRVEEPRKPMFKDPSILFALFGLSVALLVDASGASPQVSAKNSAQAAAAPSGFLATIASIPEWALRLELALRAQGASIDERKAKRALLPDVIAIQTRLSNLQSSNKKVVDELAKTNADPSIVKSTLGDIRQDIKALTNSFNSIRGKIQPLSISNLVDFEQTAEEAIGEKGLEVQSMLEVLGYADPARVNGSDTTHVDLKERSKRLKDLLKSAQDAFGSLHRELNR